LEAIAEAVGSVQTVGCLALKDSLEVAVGAAVVVDHPSAASGFPKAPAMEVSAVALDAAVEVADSAEFEAESARAVPPEAVRAAKADRSVSSGFLEVSVAVLDVAVDCSDCFVRLKVADSLLVLSHLAVVQAAG
jgi:hypothetical protein